MLSELYWLIAVPNGGNRDNAWKAHQRAIDRDPGTCRSFAFPLNLSLKVGSMDALISLCDDLSKVDTFSETVCKKLARQIFDASDPVEVAAGRLFLSVNSAKIDHYATHFIWEEAKYPSKTPLRDLTKQISQDCSKIEEELRTRSSEYNSTVANLAAAERRDAGTLLVRSLADIVKPAHITHTEHITTLFVVLSQFQLAEWQAAYESFCPFVVPRSSEVIRRDGDLVLVNIKLFKSFADEVRAKCREKRWTVRDYSLEDKHDSAAEEEKRHLQDNRTQQQRSLLAWCRLSFSEAFSSWMHIKSMRLFVESVLRYGLPPDFQGILIDIPKRGNEKKVRDLLEAQYSRLATGGGGGGAGSGVAEDDDYFPYVSIPLHLDMRPQST